jgi:hypothetical protein
MPNPSPSNWAAQPNWTANIFGKYLGRNNGQATQNGPNGPAVQLDSGSGGGFFPRQSGSTMPVPSQQYGGYKAPQTPPTQAGGPQNSGNRSMFGSMDLFPRGTTTIPDQNQSPSSRFGNGRGVAAGDYASEALAHDYGNMLGATGQQQQWMNDLLSRVRGIPQTAQQGVDMAKQTGQQGIDFAKQGAEESMKQAGKFDQMYGATKQGVNSALGEARKGMQSGIDTQQKAIDQQDFFRKDTVASGVQAIGSQFEQQRQQIQADPNMTQDEKNAAIDNMKQGMHQQISSYAADADSKAADSLLQARMGLGASKMGMGQAMGGLGMQGAGIVQSAGTSRAGAYLAAAQENARNMQQANQFYGGITQGSMAALMRAQMDGNDAEMVMIKNYPFSGPRLADTILAMMNAQGLRPGSKVTPGFGNRVGGLIGNTQFAGYA